MTDRRLIDLVDARSFRTLFIDELGWANPDQPPLQLEVEQNPYTLTQVAGYKGLRIWHCESLPPRKTQRILDALVGKDNAERLLIFTNEQRQEWRWPRKAQLGGTNAKLLVHQHVTGEPNERLSERLRVINLDFDENLSLVALLDRMRDAFDAEAETASVQAARIMGTLYAELESAHIPEHDATLLLARLLFLLFGDDADMWETALFQRFIRDHTASGTLHTDLAELFKTLDTPLADRVLPIEHPCAPFRYVNGQLYAASLTLLPLSPAFRDALVEACDFDWAIISPAIFGSMFQTVKSREARRHGGEHYTTEANILKTIRPLFLEEYADRLDAAWDDKAQLTRLHNDIGRLRFLDPACGCGNFLIVAYRELRALELDLLKRRRDLDVLDGVHAGGVNRAQLTLDVTANIKVTLDHFCGIEIEEWPARIAETAMLLVDHLANQRTALEFGIAPDRLPIAIAPTIYHGDALYTDWATVVPPGDDVVILGNPPFRGDREMSPEQKQAMQHAWGDRLTGHLDFVTGWFAKALDYYGGQAGRWAFVATNSVCQGEPVADLWKPILDSDWRCRFAHRSFAWESEAMGAAAVHVSIIGFDRAKGNPKPRLWLYPEGGQGEPTETTTARINPYLIGGPNVLVTKRHDGPLHRHLPQVAYGNMARDGGNLFVGPEEYDEVAQDPVAMKYLRKFIGADELLHDRPRWCFWMTTLDPTDLEQSPLLRDRLERVRQFRLASRAGSTRGMASTAHLFGQRTHPEGDYLAIPRHVGEHRRFFTAARYGPEVICGDANFLAPDPDGYLLGVLSSSMFIAWMRAIGGRLESRLRFSKTFTYNTFPLPDANPHQRRAIISAAAGLSAARSAHPTESLAALYIPNAMPGDILAAHAVLDAAVDAVFGRDEFATEAARQTTLFRAYSSLTGQHTETIVEQVGEFAFGDRL